MRMTGNRPQAGFTLIEIMVSTVLAAILVTALFRLWGDNQKATLRIGSKSDFRDKATLAITSLNRAITMAGFGMSKLDVVARRSSDSTDTLILYHNPEERRTTLRDTARTGATSLLVFSDSGFTVGGMLGITDSLKQQFARITGITGDSASGFLLALSSPLQYKFNPGVPDIYPAEMEKFYVVRQTHELIRDTDEGYAVLAEGITEFRVELKDGAGNAASSYKSIRVVTFALAGTYKAPEGTFNQMRFSSTVIPRNIL